MSLRIGQIRKAAKQSKYLLLRFSSGHLIGVNSRYIFRVKNNEHHGNKKSQFQSFKKVGLIEYINHKHPFI